MADDFLRGLNLPQAVLFEDAAWTSPLTGFVASLMLTLLVGPVAIRLLRKFARESIKSDSERLNQLHAAKKETPTMGGLLIVATFVVAAAAAGMESTTVFWCVTLTAIALMILGAADDWIKRTTSRKGLTARQKLFGQVLIAVVASMFLGKDRVPATSTHIVFIAVFILWSVLVITGTANAVNLTDGLDGLASGCTVITSVALGTGLIVLLGADSSTASIRQAATLLFTLAGSCAGFLWFNRHPARVFMGDAGSLPIGGILATCALATRTELSLVICGGVFVVETLSVMLQVFWYRRTKTRILLCSPLHNHFVFRGTKEQKIVAGFWIAATALSIIGVLTMKFMRLD